MNVKPFGVKQSAPDALEHLAHLTLAKSTHSKFARVFRPEPNGTPPLVGVRNGWSSCA